jgi:tetratricopeptide (TPR) repeat protein
VGEAGTTGELAAGFAGALFLLHPVQTESVSYVASRSEGMSVFFFLAAYAVFVHRSSGAISWGRSLAVLVLFGAAASSKEHTVVLPALLLLTDYFFNTPFRFEGIRKNYRLYVLLLVGAALGGVAVFRVLSSSLSAGFGLKEFTWYEYLFTQLGVIWVYVRLFLFPAGQNADYDWGVTRSLSAPGSIAGLVGIAVGLFLAWRYRRQYPLAAFGFVGFLVLLAPTSSVVPIRDIITERRLYLPFLCLTVIVIDFLRRWRPSPAMSASALGVVLAVAAFATYQRNQVWSNPVAFWQDVTQKSPKNARGWFQLAYAQWQAGSCYDSVQNYEKVGQLQKPDERLLIDWALALDCAGKPDEAVAKLRQAAALPPPSALVHAQIGMIYGKSGRAEEALAALDEAQKINPNFDMTYFYRGNVFLGRGEFPAAAAQFRQALVLNRNNAQARQALSVTEQRMARPR